MGAKPVAVPRLTCYQLCSIPNHSTESLCPHFEMCCGQSVFKDRVLPPHRQTNTDCLNLKGRNEDKTFFCPVPFLSEQKAGVWKKLNETQDGALMIGLVASVQFSPRWRTTGVSNTKVCDIPPNCSIRLSSQSLSFQEMIERNYYSSLIYFQTHLFPDLRTVFPSGCRLLEAAWSLKQFDCLLGFQSVGQLHTKTKVPIVPYLFIHLCVYFESLIDPTEKPLLKASHHFWHHGGLYCIKQVFFFVPFFTYRTPIYGEVANRGLIVHFPVWCRMRDKVSPTRPYKGCHAQLERRNRETSTVVTSVASKAEDLNYSHSGGA